ncbi:sulfur carrier protein ThiS [Candidatus Poribacteria bacterium]|nr:sulfur carrier protein ThiS [Candidatus Poribacteria bacterium]MYB65767.1 sulfur carrier protein ThiS [Candidatus Poribacteria bacterium]MYF56937.1 sulfur carrier protein ThiS [Candidatus Poribacteria bacterium]MYI94091.1 sulfur carrier protein ThiS [Candidatus Poribacteria bacterium]
MQIRLNGEVKNVEAQINIRELLIELELDPEQSGIAVAINREVISKTLWTETEICENSEVEIIRAVQGG